MSVCEVIGLDTHSLLFLYVFMKIAYVIAHQMDNKSVNREIINRPQV